MNVRSTNINRQKRSILTYAVGVRIFDIGAYKMTPREMNVQNRTHLRNSLDL